MGKERKRRCKRPIHSPRLYHELHEAYHRELRRSRWGKQHKAYGFPLLLRDGVCAADPEMSHASGIVIDSLPNDLSGKDVLDVGCGSGVISIAAAYRGATVVSCDNSRKALQLTHENLDGNPDIAGNVTVLLSDMFNGVKKQLPKQKYDYILANLWFPIEEQGFQRTKSEALQSYRRYFSEVCGLLKPNGVACLTSGAAADTRATKELMSQCGIEPHLKSVQKNHFGGQVAMNWHLYSFNRNRQPALLRG